MSETVRQDPPEASALELRLTRLEKNCPEVRDFAGSSEETHTALKALLELGDAPVDLAIRHRAHLESLLCCLHDETPFENLDDLLTEDLAAFKHTVWLRILLRDRCEIADLEETMADLSELADRVTSRALDQGADDSPPLLMLALGKWGGRELNVASDLDPVFFAPPEVSGQPGDQLVRQWLSRLAVRPGSELYPVDLRLRPEGSQGPLVASYGELERYFFQRAAPWERIAWLRARAVFGEMPGWIRQLLDAFLFGAGDDPRNRVNEVARSLLAVRRTAKPRDVKRVPGGIRDVEFLVASLQLSLGRMLPVLRNGTVLELLEVAAEENVLRSADAEVLAAGYRFARKLEHTLQARHGTARFVVPEMGHPEHTAIAAGFGLTPDEFESHWARLRASVASIVAKHLPMDTLTHESALLAVDPQGEEAAGVAEPHVNNTRGNSVLRRLGEGRIDLRELYDPHLLVGHPHEAETLLRLESAVRAYGGTTAWRQAFGSRRDLRSEMTRLLLFGSRVVEEAVKRPYLFERIGLRGEGSGTLSRKSIEGLKQELGDLLFHLGERFIAGDLDTAEFVKRWSVGVDEVVAELAKHELATAPRPTALIALGKWGGGELAPDADLDLVFVCADGSAEEVAETVKRGTDFLSRGSLDGTLLLDPRLRPEGSGAPMVITLSRLEDYLGSGRAQPWEKMALVRARLVGGDAEVGEAALKRLRSFSTALPGKAELREIDRARRKASQEQRAPGSTARIKKALGGMMDFEFSASLAAWPSEREIHGDWWARPIDQRLGDLAGWLGEEIYREAAEAYLELRRWELVQWAGGFGKRGHISLDGEDAQVFAMAAGMGEEELRKRWQGITQLGQQLYRPLIPEN